MNEQYSNWYKLLEQEENGIEGHSPVEPLSIKSRDHVYWLPTYLTGAGCSKGV